MALKLAIDAGHGMGNRTRGVYDPGAVSGRYTEAGIVLQYALALKHFCALRSVPFVMLRSDATTDLHVSRRARLAAQENATHYISIHCNAGGGRGTETYYARAEQKAWAQLVQKVTIAALGLPDRGVKPDSLTRHGSLSVLKFPGPACLLELGFIDSIEDMQIVSARDRRAAWAESLVARLIEEIGT